MGSPTRAQRPGRGVTSSDRDSEHGVLQYERSRMRSRSRSRSRDQRTLGTVTNALSAREIRASRRAERIQRLAAQEYCVSGGALPFSSLMAVAHELLKYSQENGAVLRDLFPTYYQFVNEIIPAPGVTFVLSPQDVSDVVIFLIASAEEVGYVAVVPMLRTVLEIVRLSCPNSTASYPTDVAPHVAAPEDETMIDVVDIHKQVFITIMCGTYTAVSAILCFQRSIMAAENVPFSANEYNTDAMVMMVALCTDRNVIDVTFLVPSDEQVHNMLVLFDTLIPDVPIYIENILFWTSAVTNIISALEASPRSTQLDSLMQALVRLHRTWMRSPNHAVTLRPPQPRSPIAFHIAPAA